MGALFQDIRYGTRLLGKNPGFTAVAVLTLGLGIGAATVIFSIINAVLIRPFGVVNPDDLVIVYARDPRGVQVYPHWADFFEWKEQATVFEDMVAWRGLSFTLTGAEEPAQIYSHRVSEDFFGFLKFRPRLGRTFAAEEYAAGGPDVAVLTHRFWLSQYGGDPDVLGRSMILQSGFDSAPRPFTIIGVMPRGDFQLFPRTRPDFWIPLHLSDREKQRRRSQILGVLARLKPSVSREQAEAEMELIAARLAEQYPDSNKDWGAKVVLAAEDLVQDIRPTFLVLLGAVGFLLLISSANVANLLLARAAARQKEIAIRTAHGANRWRLVRQLLTESLLLAGLGCLIGVGFAYGSLEPLLALVPDNVPYIGMGNIRVDEWVLLYSVLLAMATGVGFGLTPALEASRPDLNRTLKEGGRSSSAGIRGKNFRNLLVVGEVALALVLLIGAGLMIQSFVRLQAADPGFQSERVLTMSIFLSGQEYPPEARRTFFRELIRRIEALPGVQSVGSASDYPLAQNTFTQPFLIEGQAPPPQGEEPEAGMHFITPNFFTSIGMALRSGRNFDGRDDETALPVAIINETLARRFFPNDDPLGRRIRLRFLENPDAPERGILTIVGIVADAKIRGLAADPEPEVYFPHAQVPAPFSILTIRTAADPITMTAAVKQQIWSLDKDQPIRDVRTMEQIVKDSMWQLRFSMVLLGVFAGVALLLGAAGIYAVMSYSVNQRLHEIGIRMAMGARRGDVVRMVVGQGLKLASIGVLLGITGAYALSRVLSSWLLGLGAPEAGVQRWLPSGQRGFLYGVSANDPVTFAGIALLLLGVATLACVIPARRAARVDPLVALRYE